MKTKEEIKAQIWVLIGKQNELLTPTKEPFNFEEFDKTTGEIRALQWVLL